MEPPKDLSRKLRKLQGQLSGELLLDISSRLIYATDASVYREVPCGVALPADAADIRKLIFFAREHAVPLIPRTAGTSLAGQVVGSGLIVDVSRHLNRILEFNPEERWIRVEPGVILDELNQFTASKGLFFGPETSTSSRCMIGGMIGNNACGSHSILYGSTRDHLLSVRVILSDGTEAEFGDVVPEEYQQKCREETLEGAVYRTLRDILSDPVHRDNIRKEFPDPAIHRRNTGYALDLLLDAEPLNLCRLIAGSEGTLAFITEARLNLVPLPPKEKALVCVHCRNVADALRANLIALNHQPGSVELMDKTVLDCTRENITQRKNRFFLEGDPGAILIVEFARDSRAEIHRLAGTMEKDIRKAGCGYAFPLIFPPEMNRVWALRKAGLGVLSNFPGDRKPVTVTEDTAVPPRLLPQFVEEFDRVMRQHGLSCVHHAHAGSGELHLRPLLNLKDPLDVNLFRTIAREIALMVKKYRGSLSGEHGDGRLRSEFIPLMIGEENYKLLRRIKESWDPGNIFNPGKIVDPFPMDTSLRFQPGREESWIDTVFDFSATLGILRATEQCNGSGDCRNTLRTGRWMCPSYMATQDEKDTTRARANLLREFLTNSPKQNPFSHPEIHAIMDLCLSCKACKSECPSNVDMAKLKAEFLQHWYDARGVPFRSWLVGHLPVMYRIGSYFPRIFNFFSGKSFFAPVIKTLLGFTRHRDFPLLQSQTLHAWIGANLPGLNASLKQKTGSLYLFIDEFTNFQDVPAGIAFIRLCHALGYEVMTIRHADSGRTLLSKGMLRCARRLAFRNVRAFYSLVSADIPLVGIEPSAILGFRDEYPDLVSREIRSHAKELANHVLLYDEFLVREMHAGRIHSGQFTADPAVIRLHGHCHQKALASVEPTAALLSLPVNFKVQEIPSGCCGMAGAFGYEKEHYELSMKIGELLLFPEIRQAPSGYIIAAPGTSCRQQIREGTGRPAFHPVEVLWEAVRGRTEDKDV